MSLRHCTVWLVLIGSSARATVYIDKQLSTHCGALLLTRAASSPAQFTEQLRRLPPGGAADLDDRYADVEVLDAPGWDDTDKLNRSGERLRQLARDLDHAPSILSVTFVTRGPAVAAFLANLDLATETLDREVLRQGDVFTVNPKQSLIETAAGATVLVGGWQLAAMVPAPLVALTEAAALVGAVFVTRGAAGRTWNFWFPAEQLDLRRVRLDSHLRMINDGAPRRGRTHIGMSAHVPTELLNELLRASDWTDLNSSTWARVLVAHTSRPEDLGARLLVDHVSFTDPESDETVLLSAVRAMRERPIAKRFDRFHPYGPAAPSLGLAY